MKKVHLGSCHCGAVRFACEIDLADGTSKCNCSVCTKSRFWKAIVRADAFRLLQGQEVLSTYRFGSGSIQHVFCGRCGIKPFGRGSMPEFGEFYAVNVTSLDDATPEQLARAPVRHEDGRNNAWDFAPEEWRHL